MTVRIEVRGRGPLVVEGELELIGKDGAVLREKGTWKLRLCRCGQSGARPLCDGSHNRLPDFDVEEP